MDLTPYVTNLRSELAVAARAGGEDARALAEHLTAQLDSAVRLTLLEALSAAADEITTDLAPGSVELRLRGQDANFLVTPAPAPETAPVTLAAIEANGDGPMSRINVRLPEALKARIEAAAAKDKISANVWLIRAAATVLDSAPIHTGQPSGTRQFSGWVR